MVLDSPAACEILDGLVGDEGGIARPGGITPAHAPHRTSIRSLVRSTPRYWALATAASLMLAICIGLYSWHFRPQLADARTQLAQSEIALGSARDQLQSAAIELLRSEKERLAQLAASHRPVFLAGEATPGLLRVALSAHSHSRSVALSKDDAASIQSAAHDLRSAIEKWRSITRPSQPVAAELELVAAQIASGELAAADKALTTLEQSKMDAVPAVQNLRASWLVTNGQTKRPDEANPLFTQAADLFRQAAEGGYRDAWLNLALLRSEQNNAAEAREAARQYITKTTDAESREIVRDAFRL